VHGKKVRERRERRENELRIDSVFPGFFDDLLLNESKTKNIAHFIFDTILHIIHTDTKWNEANSRQWVRKGASISKTIGRPKTPSRGTR
jgi:hypothetical protein